MKLFSLAPLVSSLVVAGSLAGCAAGARQADSHSHSSMAMGDMKAMCDMHKKMMTGKSPAEQQTMMQEHVKSVSPEMRQRMTAMHEQCK